MRVDADMWKIALDFLKLCAIGLGAISGLIGILTNTKDRESGKTTASGRILVAIIVISGLISITSQSVEIYLQRDSDRKEHEQRVADERTTQAILTSAGLINGQLHEQTKTLDQTIVGVERTARASNATLQNTKRLSDPLLDLDRADVEVIFDSEDITGSYFHRLVGQHGPLTYPFHPVLLSSDFPDLATPDERDIYQLASFSSYTIEFARRGRNKSLFGNPFTRTLSFDARCPRNILTLFNDKAVLVRCNSSDVKRSLETEGGFRSHLDLPGAFVYIELHLIDAYQTSTNSFVSTNFSRSKGTINLYLHETGGRVLDLRHLPLMNCDNVGDICFGRKLTLSEITGI
jgi:hypothetical protein